jgi:LruC domain-containing protein
MKKINSISVMILLLTGMVIASCIKAPKTKDPDEDKEYFDFSTIGDFTLSLDYKLTFNSPIVFYVYDQYPYQKSAEDPELEVLKPDLNPVLKGITKDFGKYSGIINLKKSVNQIYIYSTTIGVVQLLKSTFANNIFSVDAKNPANYVTSSAIMQKSAGVSGSLFSSSAIAAQNAIINGGYHTLGTWDNSGVPNYLLTPRVTLSAKFIDDINASLPESRRVPIENPHFIANGVNSSLKVVESAKVEVVFVHEGASYRNVLGYFHYPTNTPPSSVNDITKIIAFPNMSFPGSSGNLQTGDRIQLKYWNGTTYSDIFPPGTSIGWFIVANGFRSNATIDPSYVHYYSFNNFNPESDPNLKPHNVLLFDQERMVVIIGFEDLNREARSDDDFNDAIFYVAATPEAAIDYTSLPRLKKSGDSDGDGIPDDRDEFPNDAAVAYSTHYPSLNAYHTIAYEDMWPKRGDYDINDVVVTYNSTHFLNNNNQIVRITDRIIPVWSGGILDVGFGYELGVNAASVSSVTKTSSFVHSNFKYKLSANGTEQGQRRATIMVFDNITSLGLNGGGEKHTFTMDIRFSSPVSLSNLTTPPYNPFIVINFRRGMEVHLPNYKPTDLADFKLFGTDNDKSDLSKNRFYVSDDEMPFAIIIPGVFDITPESMNIAKFYPKFLQWAKSFGVEYPDWYLYK